MVLPPEAIGRYQVEGRLGSGGFGTVYRAYDPNLHRFVALKVLHQHLAYDPEIWQRFLREGQALARFSHPNIVHIYDADAFNGTAFLAMELVEGHTLSDMVAALGPLALPQIVEITEQVARALAALHAGQAVHRDVKPENIMVEAATGRAVLLDFGIARPADIAAMTRSGVLLGTPGFMAPEQLRPASRITAQTDVYQLGATAYALLTGHAPFEGDQLTVLDSVRLGTPPHPRRFRRDVPEPVAGVLLRSLDKEPAVRPPGTLAFAAELRAAHNQAMLPHGASAPAPPANLPGYRPIGQDSRLPVSGRDPAAITSAPTAPSLPTGPHAPQAPNYPVIGSAPWPAQPVDRSRWGSGIRRFWPAALAGAVLIVAVIGFALLQNRDGDAPMEGAAAAAASAEPPPATASPAPSLTATVSPAQFRVTAVDNSFTPVEITAPANLDLTLDFENQGTALHNWRLLDARDAEGRAITTDILRPGSTQRIVFTISSPGTYTYACEIHPTEQRGRLTVR